MTLSLYTCWAHCVVRRGGSVWLDGVEMFSKVVWQCVVMCVGSVCKLSGSLW